MIKREYIKDLSLKSSAEAIKLLSAVNCYFDAVLYVQDERTYISVLDQNAVLVYGGTDLEELKEFFSFLNPASVFGRYDVLSSLFCGVKKVSVYKRDFLPTLSQLSSDELSSEDYYRIFTLSGLPLPPYEQFAVDFCRRKNLNRLYSFGIKDTAAAVLLCENGDALLHAVASLKKGYGTKVLNGVLKKLSYKTCFAVTEESNEGFYLKNNFIFSYFAGYKEFLL